MFSTGSFSPLQGPDSRINPVGASLTRTQPKREVDSHSRTKPCLWLQTWLSLMALCALSSDSLLASYNQPMLARQASTFLPRPLPWRSTNTRASQQAKLPATHLILLIDSPIRVNSFLSSWWSSLFKLVYVQLHSGRARSSSYPTVGSSMKRNNGCSKPATSFRSISSRATRTTSF
jgi:hypothetical protein